MLTIHLKSIQINSSKKSNDHISGLHDDETGLKKDEDLLLHQVLTVSVVILSTCSQSETSFNSKSKYSVSNIIDS